MPTFYNKVFYWFIGLSLLIRLLSIGNNNLLVEEAYYWNYAAHLDLSYLDHPPMVALLIKLFTSVLGPTEFGVRLASIFCWSVTAFFSFKLATLIQPKSGLYAVVLLSILPFFFLHSLIMTPDQPLVACWAAALYCLYRALILNESHYWYGSGFAIGLGMLSKYTIILLGPAIIFYLFFVPTSRCWFKRKEPYLAALLSMVLFLPVIYWNATHEWSSFAFQSTRRFNAAWSFSLHHLLGLWLFFLTPVGFIAFFQLFKKNIHHPLTVIRFIQIFSLFPLLFFGLFSLTHEVKFNWVGPAGLVLIPWFVMSMKTHFQYRQWVITGLCLFFLYIGLMLGISYSIPRFFYRTFLTKFIDWNDLTQQVHIIAKKIAIEQHTTPLLIPLDQYNIGSELSFYQAKLMAKKSLRPIYPVIGRHVFGEESLMYKYWAGTSNYNHNIAILISSEQHYFDNPEINKRITHDSPLQRFWSYSQGLPIKNKPFYYKVVQLKDPLPGRVASFPFAAKPSENTLDNLKSIP